MNLITKENKITVENKNVVTFGEFKKRYKTELLELRELMREGNELVKDFKGDLREPSYFIKGTVVYGNREYNEKKLGEKAKLIRQVQIKIDLIVKECKHISNFNPLENDLQLHNVQF